MIRMMANQALMMRIISAAIPLIFIILGAVFFPSSTDYWVFILIITLCAGYTHFFIGTLYQLGGINKKPYRNLNLFLFFSISIFTFFVCRVFIEFGLEVLLGAFTIVYFIIHVLLNEKTFLKAQLKLEIGYLNILSFAALIVPPFLLALIHPSFFYDFTLRYPTIDSHQYTQIIEKFISMDFLFFASLVIVGLYVITFPYRFFKKYNHQSGILCGFCGVVIFLAILVKIPFHFVYLLHFVLTYHFILMFFIFLQYFAYKNHKSFVNYVSLHVVTVVAIIGIALIPVLQIDNLVVNTVYKSVFNFGNFLTISIMHVSVSFLNEPWFTKFFKIS